MRLTLRTSSNDEQLESFRPTKRLVWEMVTSGEWSQSPFHGGRIVYEVAQAAADTWLLQTCEWSDEEADWDDPTDYERIVAVMESAPIGLTAVAAARHLYEAWCATGAAKVITETYEDGLLDDASTTDDSDSDSLDDLPDVEARRQAVADDLAKNERNYADIDGLELADLLGVTPGDAGDRIHLCAIDEDETAQWLQEELSQGEGDGSELLEKVLSPTRRKKLRRYLDKVEEGEDVNDFTLTPRELKQLAPLRARKRLEDGEIDKAWSYDDVVAPDGAKLIFTFDIGEDGEVEGCLATPYDGRREPDPKEYVWE
jgi:hypothetical protein